MKKRLILVFQILVSVGFLIWIFQNREMRHRLVVGLEEANVGWLVAGLAVSLAYNLLGVMRWNIFLRLLGIRIPTIEVTQIYFVGLLFNTLLIGQLGGDAVKVLILIGQGHDKIKAILSVILDRISGLSALIILSWIYIRWEYNWLKQNTIAAGLVDFVILYLITAAFLLIFSFVIAKAALLKKHKSLFGMSKTGKQNGPIGESPCEQEKEERIEWRHRSVMAKLSSGYLVFLRKWPRSLIANGMSLLMLIGYYSVFFCSAKAFGSAISIPQLFALMPVVDIITSLPISIGGVGVREQLFIVLLGKLGGTSEATAVLISMCGFIMTILWGAIGIFTFPFYRGWIALGKKAKGT